MGNRLLEIERDGRIIRDSGTLIFSLICSFEHSTIRLYNEIKKGWWTYERKEKSFVCG